MAGAGDVDGDGRSDLLIGDAGYQFDLNGQNGTSHGYLHNGRLQLALGATPPTSDLVLPQITSSGDYDATAVVPGLPSDQLGISVQGLGDVDGDGFDDILVGARDYAGSGEVGTSGVPNAFILFGHAGDWTGLEQRQLLGQLDSTNGYEIPGEGAVLSAAGDVNGDGFADVVRGARVLLGSADGLLGSAQTRASPAQRAFDGTEGLIVAASAHGGPLIAAGDLNGDGADDLIALDPGAAPGALAGAGAAQVIYGRLGATAGDTLSDGFVIAGGTAGDGLGARAATGFDFNNDGFDDIALVADGADGGKGAIRVFYGSAAGVNLDGAALDGTDGFSILGADGEADLQMMRIGGAIASPGDMNGDGYDDLAFTAEGVDGRPYILVLNGGASMDAESSARDLLLSGAAQSFEVGSTLDADATASYGLAVAGLIPLGDFDGDGLADLAYTRAATDAYYYTPNANMWPYGGVIYGVGENELRLSIGIEGETDPTFARDDAFAPTTNATFHGWLFADNGAGADYAVDEIRDINGPLRIARVHYNGSAAGTLAGSSTVLDDGGRVLVNEYGEFWFNPLDDFADLAPGASRQISFQYSNKLADKAVTATSDLATVTLTVTAPGVYDPNFARNDNFGIGFRDTLAGDLFADNGSGLDRSPVGSSLTITAVDGVAAHVGQSYDLAGGGRVLVEADGDFTFQPDGDFDDMPGASTRDVTFAYTARAANGATDDATVTLSLARPEIIDARAIVATQLIHGDLFADHGHGTDRTGDPDAGSLQVSHAFFNGDTVGSDTLTADLDAGGKVTIRSDGAFWFDPQDDFTGPAPGASVDVSFAYTLSQSNAPDAGDSDPATVTITVSAPAGIDTDFAKDDAFALEVSDANPYYGISGGLFADNGAGVDRSPVGRTLVVSAVEGDAAGLDRYVDLDGGGRVYVQADGSFQFRGDADFDDLAEGESRQTSFTYTERTTNGLTDDAVATFTVTRPALIRDFAFDDALTARLGRLASFDLFDDNGSGADFGPIRNVLQVSAVDGSSAKVGDAASAAFEPDGGGLVHVHKNGRMWFSDNGDFDHLGAGESAEVTFAYTARAADGRTDTADVTITVEGSDPPEARDDWLATGPGRLSAMNVFGDNGSGADLNPDGRRLTVTRIDGDADLVGEAVIDPSGWRWRLYDDGRFWINARDGFDDLGPGQSRDLEFDYTVMDDSGQTSAAHVILHVDGDLMV